MNWDKFDEGTVQPRWLPRSPAVLQERMGTIDLDPAASDEGLWWLPRALMVEATPELDALFPVGTVMPSEIGRAHSELQSLMRISYAVFCLKKKKEKKTNSN